MTLFLYKYMAALKHCFHIDMDKDIIGIKKRCWQMERGVKGVVTAQINTVHCQHLINNCSHLKV